jgi:glycerophosphoryl diester phosphodiesterase
MFIFLRIIKGLSFLGLGGAVIFSGFYAYLSSSNGKPAGEFKIFAEQNKERPLVFAHRGGKGIAPENTLTAFQKSYDLGVDVLELDIHATKDGELVIIHDKTVDRTTNEKGLVADKTLAEIKELDAGYKWTNDDGKTFPFRGKDVKIPTLREVFEAFPDAIINIEPKYEKPSPVKPLCGLITEFKRTDKVIIGSFNDDVLEDFRQTCKGVATSASPSEATGFLARYKVGLDDNYMPKMSALQIPQRIGSFEIVTKDYLKAAHAQNLQVHVWTINKTEDMKHLIEIGVDGIMTDYPDRLLELLETKKEKK